MLGRKYKNDGKSILKLNELQIKMKRQVELKIQQGVYRFERKNCCICNREKFITLSKKDRFGLYMPVVVCQTCGLIQINPRMTQNSNDNFYKVEYKKLYRGRSKPTDENFKIQYHRGEIIYRYLIENHSFKKEFKKMFVLEVGCGTGGILRYFEDKGCRVQGIDLNEAYINFGKTVYNLDLKVGKLSDISLDVAPDLIIYSHVLEHILNPREELTNVNKVLDDDGVLYIEVPGVKYLLNSYRTNFLRYLQNAHSHYFSLRTLRNLLEINGFQMIHGNEFIRSIFKKSNGINNTNKIINDYPEVVLFLHKLENLKILYYIKYLIKNYTKIMKHSIWTDL